ncbi:MAG: hypothetical protein L6Q38_14300 [Nitrospira sp.]|nr:hypothetical protein [Planctomycetota bacterium]MCK6500643.1 hypothetical protein [Nitrospira sp.]
MATRLRKGCFITRIVPSKAHDCRKNGELVITLDNELGLPVIRMRPLGTRRDVSYPLDAIYSFLVKQHAEYQRRESRKG